MKRIGKTAVAAIVLGVFTAPTLTMCAFGQQEVDPSWYDPWAKATMVTAQQTKAAKREHKKTTVASAAQARVRKNARSIDAHREAPRTEVVLATK